MSAPFAPPHSIVHWQTAPSRLMLTAHELHLWRIVTDDSGMALKTALALLDPRQRARAANMGHRASRATYLRTQAGLRLILARYLQAAPETIRYDHGPAGKPFVADAAPGELAFNLTTSGALALVGLSQGRELGVDCEWLRPRRNWRAIAERRFSPAVAHWISASADEPQRLARFHQAWTAHEADVKADGRGLFRPRPANMAAPQIRHCIPRPGYIAAIASVDVPPPELWRTFQLIHSNAI